MKEIEGEKCVYVTAGANSTSFLFSLTVATAVITEGGRLWTFGQGDSNQLGHGNTEDSSNQVLPYEIEDEFDGEAVICCSVSDGHMAAVTADGSVWTWGRGTFGRLGHEYVLSVLSFSPILAYQADDNSFKTNSYINLLLFIAYG